MPPTSTTPRAGDPSATATAEPLTRRERGLAAVVGAVSAGGVAVFLSDKQAGTAALFVIAALFLSCAVFGLKPRSFTFQGATVDLTLAASAAALDRLGRDADPVIAT